MASDAERAKTYRDLAVKTRAMAQGVMPAEHKQALLEIADRYDRLAERTEAYAQRRDH